MGLWKGKLVRGGIFAVAIAAVMILSAGSAAATAAPAAHSAAPTSPVKASPSAAAHSLPPPAKLRGLFVGPAHILSTHATGHGTAVSYSGNWAGYADIAKAGDGVTQEVTAEWYTPTISCSNAPSGGDYEVMWIGIDGWATDTVEQVGTLSYCATTGATPGYYSWWEFFPYNDIQTVSSIGGGNFVQAYVDYNPAGCVGTTCGIYTLVFSNIDNYADNFQVTGNPTTCNAANGACETGADSGPECISEAPSGFGYSGVTPLADYGKLTFYACAAEINGKFAGIASLTSVATVDRIDQVGGISGKVIQSTATAISYFYGKSEFAVTWKGLD